MKLGDVTPTYRSTPFVHVPRLPELSSAVESDLDRMTVSSRMLRQSTLFTPSDRVDLPS